MTVSGDKAARTMCPVSVTTTALVRRPLVMSMMRPLVLHSCTRRLVGAELGETIAITRLIAKMLPNPIWISSVL